MRTTSLPRAIAIAARACIVLTVSSVPAFAQSHSVHGRDAWDTARADTAFSGAGLLRPYTPMPSAAPLCQELPANLDVTDPYRRVVESMQRLSPTFGRQCLRIAAAHQLSVVVRAVHHPLDQARARTRLTFGPGSRIDAVVELAAVADAAELIAHELEHIIEQLDGVDLSTRATHVASGVRHCAGGAFETIRAAQAGRAAAAEVRRGGRKAGWTAAGRRWASR